MEWNPRIAGKQRGAFQERFQLLTTCRYNGRLFNRAIESLTGKINDFLLGGGRERLLVLLAEIYRDLFLRLLLLRVLLRWRYPLKCHDVCMNVSLQRVLFSVARSNYFVGILLLYIIL